MLFTSKLGWLPSGTQASAVTQATVETKTHIFLLDTVIAGDADAFLDGLEHLAMPAITLGLLMAGVFIRLVRVNVAQSMRDDYIEAARARGVPERTVVIRHAFRNAMVPFVTILGLQVALLFGGAILTEQTFSWPGIGTQLLRYLNNRDYSAVQGIITVFALVVVLISLAIDIINALIDPRVRY
jgi:peptide/nickel transport system permease protein